MAKYTKKELENMNLDELQVLTRKKRLSKEEMITILMGKKK